jgi:hypothetical protein
MSFMITLLLVLGGANLHAGTQGNTGAYWIGGATLGGAVVILYFWHSLLTSISQPLKLATDVARSIAGGDLSSKFASSRKDDTGQLLRALQQMTVNLVAIIGDVRANVDSIQVSTKEIAKGNMDLSGRTEAQASSLEETAASMEELAATVRQNAENAMQANKPTSLHRRHPKSRLPAVKWCIRSLRPWAKSATPQNALSISSESLTASHSRPTSLLLTQLSRRRALVSKAADLPSSPPKCAVWLIDRLLPPKRSKP